MRLQLLFILLLAILLLVESHTTTDAASRYRQARYIRTTQGHDAALPLWKDLLEEFSTDRTAATWIASSRDSLRRQDQLVDCKDRVCQQRFIQLLKASNYSPQAIADCIFGDCYPTVMCCHVGSTLQSCRASLKTLYIVRGDGFASSCIEYD